MATKTAAPSTWKSKSLWPTIKETLAKAADIVVFDLETTGLSSANDRIIEFAAIKYHIGDDYELTECGSYHTYINPERDIPEKITELTGISNETVADAPTEAECIQDIKAFFNGCIISGYNIDNFDVKFMMELYGRFGLFFEPIGSVDGIKMARNRLVRGVDVEGYKLSGVGDYFGIVFQAHSAMEDTRTTGKLIQLFLREYVAEENAEVETPTAAGTLRPAIRQVSFWEGFKGFSRIYVNMDIGSVYYDIRSSSWGGKDIDVNELDMEWLESTAYSIVGATNEKEFSAFRGSITV